MDHVQIKEQAGLARGQTKIWNTVRRLEPQEAQSRDLLFDIFDKTVSFCCHYFRLIDLARDTNPSGNLPHHVVHYLPGLRRIFRNTRR